MAASEVIQKSFKPPLTIFNFLDISPNTAQKNEVFHYEFLQ